MRKILALILVTIFSFAITIFSGVAYANEMEEDKIYKKTVKVWNKCKSCHGNIQEGKATKLGKKLGAPDNLFSELSKKEIEDLPYGLNFINLLRPVSYKWKPQADKLDKDGNLIAVGEKNHTHQRTMFGLLGQQVREATKKLGLGYNDFSGFSDQEYENRNNLDWKKTYTMEDKTIQLTYDDFIAPLIKSVQELSAEVDSLKKQLKTT